MFVAFVDHQKWLKNVLFHESTHANGDYRALVMVKLMASC